MAIRVDFNTGSTTSPTWTDITTYVRSVSISRGKDELLDGFSAGTANIELDNRDRRFDPLYTASPYNGDIVPRREVRVFYEYGTATETRTNLVLNPEPAYDISNRAINWYTDLGPTERPDDGFISSPSFERSASVANPDRPYRSTYVNFAATPGSMHAISAEFVRRDAVNFDMVMNLLWFTAGTVSTGVGASNIQPPEPTTSSKFLSSARLAVFGVAPADASFGQVEFTTNPYYTLPTADFFTPLVKKVVVEVGSQVNKFYSGDTTDTATEVYAWAGTPGDSVSTGTFQVEAGFVFSGFIDDWDLFYELGGNNTATIKATDGLGLLSNQAVADQTMTIELSGVRIAQMLSEPGINYPGPQRAIQTGVKFLGTDVTSGTNALSYAQQIESSELGQLFVARDGDITFLDASQNNPKVADSVQTFSDDGTGIPFTSLQVAYGTEQLTNALTVTYPEGAETAINQDSVTAYGVTSLSVDTLNQNSTDVFYLADYYTTRFGSPQYRVDSITVNVYSLSEANQTAVLGLDLGKIVTIKFTPGNMSPQIVQYAKVVRINSNISEGAKLYEIEFGLETFQTFPFILNDATAGKLNSTYVLGF